MTSGSHLASSVVVYFGAVALAEVPVSVEAASVVAFGSLLPDVDTPTSSIGRPIFPIAKWINQKIGHRTVTHGLLGLVCFFMLLQGVAWLWDYLGPENLWGLGGLADGSGPGDGGDSASFPVVWLLALGYASHIVVDTFHKQGVELLWPAKLRCVLFYNINFRIRSGGKGDYWFLMLCIFLSLGMYPLAKDGFTLSLHRAFGDIYSVVMDYRRYADRHRVWLRLEGHEAISGQRVMGRFEILAATDNAAVLINRDGVKQIVSRTAPYQIYPEKVFIEIGETVQITIHEIDMAGKSLSQLPEFRGAEKVLYYGYLTPVRLPSLALHEDQFNPITKRLDKLKLEHAEYQDLADQGLEALLIREGVLVAKVCRFALFHDPVPALPGTGARLGQIELKLDPRDRLLIEVGDTVQSGQVIGRQDVAARLERLKEEFEDSRGEIEMRIGDETTKLEKRLTENAALLRQQNGLSRWAQSLEQEPLLLGELGQVRRQLKGFQQSLVQNREDIHSSRREIRSLRAKLEEAGRRHLGAVQKLQEESAILASFEGIVVRLERRAEGEKVAWSIVYRSPHDRARSDRQRAPD